MNTSPDFSPPGLPRPALPWWREPYVWLVIAGPVAVIVACAVTAVLVLQQTQVEMTEAQYQARLQQQAAWRAQPAGLQPAVTGRNHAATQGEIAVSPRKSATAP